jgi:hypothetical protein
MSRQPAPVAFQLVLMRYEFMLADLNRSNSAVFFGEAEDLPLVLARAEMYTAAVVRFLDGRGTGFRMGAL